MKFFKIYRWDPDVPGQKPYTATYPVNMDECVMRRRNTDAIHTITARSPPAQAQMWAHVAGCTDQNQE